MRRLISLVAGLCLAVTPAAATASHNPSGNPPRDFAVGSGETSFGGERFAFSAVSDRGPGDGDDQGHLTYDGPVEGQLFEPGLFVDDDIHATVLCVNAVGNRAEIIANVTRFGLAFQPPPPGHVNVLVKDGGGPGGEGDEFILGGASAILQPPIECPPPLPVAGNQLTRGNIVVHDGAAP